MLHFNIFLIFYMLRS